IGAAPRRGRRAPSIDSAFGSRFHPARGGDAQEASMTVLTERDGPVAIVTLDRPRVRNAVDPATAAQLFAAFAEAERDESVLATVLTGAGGHFCAGFDLKVAADPETAASVPSPGPQAGPMGPSRLLADRDAAEPGV